MKMKPLALLLVFAAGVGCCGMKPLHYRFVNLPLVREADPDGKFIKNSADCRQGKQIGWDAKTKTAVIDCGGWGGAR
jgi:hypothetical protein